MSFTVSIIIPLYNAEPYIGTCLESLLNQTLPNVQIVVVDDCSSDNSLQLVQQIQESHALGQNIKIVQMPHNSGAAQARNRGILEAQGEYVAFVDADDWCETDMFQSLYVEARKIASEWAFCFVQKNFSNGRKLNLRQPLSHSSLLNRKNRSILLTQGVAFFWTAIYKRSFILEHKLFFPEGKFSEDSFFWWMVVMFAHKVAIVPTYSYHYRIHNNSVSKRPDATKSEQKQAMYSLLLQLLKKKQLYDPYHHELDYLYIKKGFLIPLIIKAINVPRAKKVQYHLLFAQMQRDEIYPYKNPYFRHDIKAQLLFLIFKYGTSFVSRLIRLKFKTDPF